MMSKKCQMMKVLDNMSSNNNELAKNGKVSRVRIPFSLPILAKHQ